MLDIKQIKENMEYYILLMIIFIGITVEILHMFDIIEGISPVGILVFISTLISSALIMMVRKVDGLRRTVDSIINSIAKKSDGFILLEGNEEFLKSIAKKSGGFLLLDGYDAFYKRTEQEALKAKRSIDVTHFFPIPPTDIHNGAVNSYFKALEKIIIERKPVIVRRVVTIKSPEKLEWVKDTIYRLKNEGNFYVHYSNLPEDFPLLNILIFDNTKVFIGIYSETAELRKAMFVDNSAVAAVFCEYFEKIWDKTEKDFLKSGMKINERKLQEIEKEINASR